MNNDITTANEQPSSRKGAVSLLSTSPLCVLSCFYFSCLPFKVILLNFIILGFSLVSPYLCRAKQRVIYF